MASSTPVGMVIKNPPVEHGRTLNTALAGQHNSLGLVRLVLAALVIFDHAFPLGGFGEDPMWRITGGQASLGSLAVGGFFAVSGYLIVKSAARTDVLQFLWRRSIRIFPAFWGVLLVGALIVGPVVWLVRRLPLASYFTAADGPFHYLASNFTLSIGAYGISDVFIGTPYGQLVGGSVLNGSLWTLAYEWGCYLFVAILAVSAVITRARFFVLVITGVVIIARAADVIDPGSVAAIAPFLADAQILPLLSAFMTGASLGLFADRVPFDDRLGVFAALTLVASLIFGGFAVAGVVAGSYFVLYLAARLPRSLQWIGARNDYSYGVYVYGFLIQQCLAAAGAYRFGYIVYVAAALPLTFACAWCSWHLIEKRALGLKDWGPGRGVDHWRGAFVSSRHRRAAARRHRPNHRRRTTRGESRASDRLSSES